MVAMHAIGTILDHGPGDSLISLRPREINYGGRGPGFLVVELELEPGLLGAGIHSWEGASEVTQPRNSVPPECSVF